MNKEMESFDEVKVSHILGEGNGPADLMAVRGSTGIEVQYVWRNLPSILYELIKLDGRNSYVRKSFKALCSTKKKIIKIKMESEVVLLV